MYQMKKRGLLVIYCFKSYFYEKYNCM